MPRVSKTPICLYCKSQPAKVLYPEDAGKKIFCTVRCAANHGLMQASEEMSWCPKHREWFITVDDCPEDHPEDEEDEEEDEDE